MIDVDFKVNGMIPFETSDYHTERMRFFKWLLIDLIEKSRIKRVNREVLVFEYSVESRSFKLLEASRHGKFCFDCIVTSNSREIKSYLK